MRLISCRSNHHVIVILVIQKYVCLWKKHYKNEGLTEQSDFDSLAKDNPTGYTIGYHFGGILSVIDNVNINNSSNNQERLTVASNRIFAITIVPTATTAP